MVTAEQINPEQPVADYLQRLDLGAGAPMGTADYFYAGAERRNVLDQIVHYCRFSEQLVVLTAAQGSGKTTLVDATVVQLNSILDCCRLLATDISSTENIIQTLGRILHLPLTSLSTRDFLDCLSQRTVVDGDPEPVLIIIEQVESLPLAQLESLVKLHEMARSSMHLLLVGTLPLQRRIEKIAIENPNIKQFTLRPLTLAELESYTLSRLQSVGYKGVQPLSQDQLVVLHEQSGGVIAEINRMMPLLLDGGLQTASPVQREFLPRAHLLVLGLLFLLLFIAFIFEFGMEADAPGETTETQQRASQELPINLPPRPVERTPASVSVKEVPRPDQLAVAAQVFVPPQSEPESVAVSRASVPVDVAPVVVTPVVATPVVAKPIVAKPVAATPVVKATPPKPNQAPIVKAEKPAQPQPNVTLSARDQHLLAMKATDSMLQVLGSSNEQGVRDYVKRYVGQLPISYFETTMRGKPWYVVLVGPYATRELAEQAVHGFPAGMQQQSPWVRTVASVQADIRARPKR